MPRNRQRNGGSAAEVSSSPRVISQEGSGGDVGSSGRKSRGGGGRGGRGSSSSGGTAATNDDHHDVDVSFDSNFDGGFSQVEPERCQSVPEAKVNDKKNFESLDPTTQEKLVKSLTRLLLFKGLAGEVLDRKKCLEELELTILGKENYVSSHKQSISKRVFELATERIRMVFGYHIVKVPVEFENLLSARFKDRYYMTNPLDDDHGHAQKLHAISDSGSKERSLLLIVLSLAHCKGTIRRAGSSSGSSNNNNKKDGAEWRWITDEQLYRLLNSLDDMVSEEPPAGKAQNSGTNRRDKYTREIDDMIDLFVQRDYLLKEKVQDNGGGAADVAPSGGGGAGPTVMYAMGPRSWLEIGRKQLIYFMSEMLDEKEPDPTMLAEIGADESSEEEEESGDEEDEGE